MKFQAYVADDMCPRSGHPAYKLTSGPWAGRTLWNLYRKAQTPYDWFPALFDCATSHNIIAFASVFSRRGVDMLEELDCPAYKIASAEVTDLPLLRYVAATSKPVILSTGMATDGEVYVALRTIFGESKEAWDNVALLHCVSSYPAPFESMNLRQILDLAGVVGLSDHSRDLIIPPMAVALGASIIEKHIMDYQPNESLDNGFALDPYEFAETVTSIRDAEAALNIPTYDAESDSRQFRRRLVYTSDIHAGDMITESNTRTARCSEGIYPVRLEGHMMADTDAKAGDPVL